MAYIRTMEEEKVLVVINPSDKEQSIPWTQPLKEVVYQFGNTAVQEQDTLKVAAQSAGYYRI